MKSWMAGIIFAGALALSGGSALAHSEDVLSCGAEAAWINCGEAGVSVTSRVQQTVILHLLGNASQPRSCLPADLTLTAAYIDSEGSVLCVGILERAASQTTHTQTMAFEIAPLTVGSFARWLNRPLRQSEPSFTLLRCMSADGRTQLLDTHLERASSVQVTASLLPELGGVATAACRVGIVR